MGALGRVSTEEHLHYQQQTIPHENTRHTQVHPMQPPNPKLHPQVLSLPPSTRNLATTHTHNLTNTSPTLLLLHNSHTKRPAPSQKPPTYHSHKYHQTIH